VSSLTGLIPRSALHARAFWTDHLCADLLDTTVLDPAL
jgi:hypothetical protein